MIEKSSSLLAASVSGNCHSNMMLTSALNTDCRACSFPTSGHRIFVCEFHYCVLVHVVGDAGFSTEVGAPLQATTSTRRTGLPCLQSRNQLRRLLASNKIEARWDGLPSVTRPPRTQMLPCLCYMPLVLRKPPLNASCFQHHGPLRSV